MFVTVACFHLNKEKKKRLGEFETRGRTEIVQITAQLRLSRILTRILKI